jgi:glycyl-tRNA synthetase
MEHFEAWRERRMRWHLDNGVRPERLRWHVHEKLAHYADAAQDVQYQFPFGWNEVEGVHSRTDFDLRRHQEYSGKKMEYFDPQTNERYVPFVVETAAGLDRTILMLLFDAYHEEEVEGAAASAETRSVLRFHPALAPYAVAVFPLVKKDGMPERAHAIEADLRRRFHVFYDEKGAVGRRYRRQDEIGTPFCVTVDGQTLEDGTVTVRDRDSMRQDRIEAGHVGRYVEDRIEGWTPAP